MSKMLVATFDEESKAFEGSRALTQLHRDGAISVYAAAVIGRDADGKISVKDEIDEGPIGTALGMMTGALIGMWGGPAGVVVGTAAGGMAGWAGDLFNLGVGADFVDDVGAQLEPGKTAVVAEIGENWVTPVDTRMAELGGTVIRRNRLDVEDEQIEREIAATKAELAELKAEYKAASAENKAKLQAKIDATKAKLSAAGDRAKAKADSYKKENEAKLIAVQAQMAEAKAEAKANLEKRSAELKSDYEARSNKVKQAWERTKEAVAG
jgi:uncharacterized membrane protein